MKKLLLMFSLLLVLSLGACNSVPTDTDLENRVDILEQQVSELEQILIDLEIIEGLNGQREYFVPQATGLSAMAYEVLGAELNTKDAPSYVLNDKSEYIPFYDVVELLVAKYYGDEVQLNTALIGFQVKITLEIGDISLEEFMAQTIMLIDELSHYDFYLISASELYIQLDNNPYGYIKIPMQTLRSSFITMTPQLIIEGTYEVILFQLDYDNKLVEQFHTAYKTSKNYDGYVLDYE